MTVCTRCAWLYKALLKRWQINVMFEYVWNIWELATQMPRRQMVTGGHQRNTHKNGHHKSPETYLAAGEWILHCNENLVKNYEHVQCSHVFPHHFAGASGSPAATKDSREIAGAWQAAPVQTSALYQALKGFRWASEQEETSQWLPSGCHMLPPFVQIVQMVHKSKNWNRKHCKFSNHRDLWNSMCPSTEGILRGHFRSQRSCSWCSVGSTIFNAWNYTTAWNHQACPFQLGLATRTDSCRNRSTMRATLSSERSFLDGCGWQSSWTDRGRHWQTLRSKLSKNIPKKKGALSSFIFILYGTAESSQDWWIRFQSDYVSLHFYVKFPWSSVCIISNYWEAVAATSCWG